MARITAYVFGLTWATAVLLSARVAAGTGYGITTSVCKSVPGDPEWPSPEAWARLNRTVNGRLIATAPRAGVCHTAGLGSYDEAACEALKTEWDYAQAQ